MLAAAMIFGAGRPASAQPADMTCGYYRAHCQGQAGTPSCTRLQSRCAAPGSAGLYIQSPDGHNAAMPRLDNPSDMPDCGPNEEMVMVPTCQCATPLSALGAPQGHAPGEPDDSGACAECTSDGVRMACQKTR